MKKWNKEFFCTYKLVYCIGFVFILGTNPIFCQEFFRTNKFGVIKEDLGLVENARIVDTVLRLTGENHFEQGACWYKKQKVDLIKGFETEFSFRIWAHDPKNGAGDGFAFVIQAQGDDVIGGVRDSLGYQSIPKCVVIEFDTKKDDSDFRRNQVSLMEYDPKTKQYKREATVHEIPELADGAVHFARVEYKGGFLRFFIDSYLFPVLSYRLDIATRIGATDGRGWMGFTSSTSESYSNHDIISWHLVGLKLAPNLHVEKVKVTNTKLFNVRSRKLIIRVWDHNKIDGDIISLKFGNDWLLTNYTLEGEKYEIDATLTGFSGELTMYAHNLGSIPPNTAAIEVYDGFSNQRVNLNADLKTSESITLKYIGQ